MDIKIFKDFLDWLVALSPDEFDAELVEDSIRYSQDLEDVFLMTHI